LIFGCGSWEEWNCILQIFKLFTDAYGMEISQAKSSFYSHGIGAEVLDKILILLPFPMDSMDKGFKYLGYFLKPNCYHSEDWCWLLRKMEKRVGLWC